MAQFFALALSVTCSINTQNGFGRHLWDVPFSVFSPNFMKVVAIGVTCYGISIMLTKLSMLTFFLRFVPTGYFQVTIYITMAIVLLYSLVTSFQWVYACQPLKKYWDLTSTSGSCIDRLKIAVFGGVMNTITDTVILILPVLFLRDLKLPKKQKIGVMIVLMTGGFVLVVSIISVKATVGVGYTKDFTWEGFPNAVWRMIEAHVAIVCACLPAGKPFLRKHMPRVIGSSNDAASAAIKLRTIHSTHTQRLPSRDADDDPQDTILRDDSNKAPRMYPPPRSNSGRNRPFEQNTVRTGD
ncbi:hypothetical protein GQ44DRAFT_817984 [Phaeosphaeriaceae sp. PMI808]|nr:hypothetical protein GQ44DRAFT_817984 [Phaeosphaeriaceae sp. PMI808]